MLVYIIDGFNVVHKLSDLRKSTSPQKDLIHYIKVKKLTGSKNNRVIVVFDGTPDFGFSEKEFGVLYSMQRSADEVIIEKVVDMRNRSNVVVVTDDREIRDKVKAYGVRLLAAKEFIFPKKKNYKNDKKDSSKDISYSLQRQITQEMRKIWLK